MHKICRVPEIIVMAWLLELVCVCVCFSVSLWRPPKIHALSLLPRRVCVCRRTYVTVWVITPISFFYRVWFSLSFLLIGVSCALWSLSVALSSVFVFVLCHPSSLVQNDFSNAIRFCPARKVAQEVTTKIVKWIWLSAYISASDCFYRFTHNRSNFI